MKVFSFLFWFVLCLPFVGLAADSPEAQKLIAQGEEAYASGQYREALKNFETVYKEGVFSESMLYRMASSSEMLGEYGMAVYYLKKIRQEYGSELLDDKIRELMLKAGSQRTFSESGYATFYRFFKSWGLLLWILFGLFALLIALDLFWVSPERPLWRQIGAGTLWFLFLGLLALHAYNLFFTPDRAVVVDRTSYYAQPGYSADNRSNVFGQGETVNVLGEQDIWYQIEAGGEKWWVPQWTLKRL